LYFQKSRSFFQDGSLYDINLKTFFTIARLNINNLSLNVECFVNGMFKVKSYFAI